MEALAFIGLSAFVIITVALCRKPPNPCPNWRVVWDLTADDDHSAG